MCFTIKSYVSLHLIYFVLPLDCIEQITLVSNYKKEIYTKHSYQKNKIKHIHLSLSLINISHSWEKSKFTIAPGEKTKSKLE